MAGSVYGVSATLRLDGAAASEASGAAAALAAVLAAQLGVSRGAVAVTGVADATPAGRRRRRALQAPAADVSFAAAAPSYAAAQTLLARLAALDPAALLAAVRASPGLGGVTAARVSAPALTAALAAPPPPAPPGAAPPRVGAVSITQAPAGAAGARANPGARTTLAARVASDAPASLVLTWSCVSSVALNLSDPARVSGGTAGAVLTLLPGALAPGAAYTFTLSAADAGGAAAASADLVTLQVPVGGALAVSARSGTALATRFTLTTTDWADATGADGALEYAFWYAVLAAGGGAGAAVLLADFSANASTLRDVLLPAGSIVLQAAARNAQGGVSVQLATAGVQVAEQRFASADAQASFLNALAGSLAALGGVGAVALATSAADMLNDPSSPVGGNASAAADVRAALLASIAGAATSAATLEALTSVASAVATLVKNATQVSAAGAATALAMLARVAAADGGALFVSDATSSAVVAGLSSLAAAALVPGGAVGAGALAQVAAVADALASSLLNQLTQPGGAPVSASSALVQLSVALDAPGAGSRLFTAPLSAPGSPSVFAPLPADVFEHAGADTAGGVRTLFSSLAFDPFSPGGGGTGVTTLALSSSGGDALRVAGLRTPIYFTLPAVSLGDGEKSVCAWWDAAARNYSTAGCAGIPALRPPGHTLAWVAGFNATSDADMAAAWSISGPLADGCKVTVLDCSADAVRVVFPDPLRPLAVPAVECPAGAAPALRVYSGQACQLWQRDNGANCSWDNVRQAFVGASCMASGAPAQCACRHLTSFASAKAPSLPECSLADMLALTPGELIGTLRLLFIVVFSLFAAMVAGAAVGFVLDRAERRRTLMRLQADKVGFRETRDGAWLWRFALSPLESELAPPSGTAVALSAIMGMPFARLRAALPDELLTSTMGDALGRRHSFSPNGFEASQGDHAAALRLVRSCRLAPEGADGDGVERTSPRASALPRSSAQLERFEELIGTSLVLAYLQVTQLVPVVEVEARAAAAARHFRGTTTPSGWDFSHMRTTFITLVSPGVLNVRAHWLQRARLWRLILAQHVEGFWDASATTAFALEARSLHELRNLPSTWRTRAQAFARAFMETLSQDEVLDVHELIEGAAAAKESEAGAELRAGEGFGASADDAARAGAAFDCPLTNSPAAIEASLPRPLRALHDEDAGVAVVRVWTTMCCICFLERQRVSWLWGDGDAYYLDGDERTLVDAAREWIDAHAAEHPALAALLRTPELWKVAANTVHVWHRASEARVAELRSSKAVRAQMNLSHAHRSLVAVLRALITRHDTFSTFLSEPLEGLQRWQSAFLRCVRALVSPPDAACAEFVILITIVCSQLLVNIWMCATTPRAVAAQPHMAALTCACVLVQVLRKGRQLLCRRSRAAGRRRPGRVPAHGPVPRLRRPVLRPAGAVRGGAGAARLPGRAGRLHVRRVSKRRRAARRLHRGPHRAGGGAAGHALPVRRVRAGQRQRGAKVVARVERHAAQAHLRRRGPPPVALHARPAATALARALVRALLELAHAGAADGSGRVAQGAPALPRAGLGARRAQAARHAQAGRRRGGRRRGRERQRQRRRRRNRRVLAGGRARAQGDKALLHIRRAVLHGARLGAVCVVRRAPRRSRAAPRVVRALTAPPARHACCPRRRFIFTCPSPSHRPLGRPIASRADATRARARPCQTACSSTSCWGPVRRAASRAPGASATDWVRRSAARRGAAQRGAACVRLRAAPDPQPPARRRRPGVRVARDPHGGCQVGPGAARAGAAVPDAARDVAGGAHRLPEPAGAAVPARRAHARAAGRHHPEALEAPG
jgi:hypothetical protein